MTYPAELKDYERLLASLSHKALRRATTQGCRIEFDDLFQEAKITFVHARDKFDPEQGVKFSTYLWQAVRNNLMRLTQRAAETDRNSRSLDERIGDEDGGTLHDILPAQLESIEERMERMERSSVMFGRLSYNARRVIVILDAPSPELVRELRRAEAFRRHCKANDYAASQRVLDVGFVCTALGFDSKETRRVKREFKDIMEEVYG